MVASRWHSLWARLAEYREYSALAKQQTGKGRLAQFREILALRKLGGQCGATDYYWFKLYDASYLKGRGAEDFLGWRLEPLINPALNPRHAVLPAWDKVVFAVLADAAGLPIPEMKSCYHRAQCLPPVLGRHLETIEDAECFLRDPASYPVFTKPAFSQQGEGACYLAGYDRATDSVVLGNEESMPVSDFVRRLDNPVDYRYHKPECGFLFQEVLKLHPDIHSLTGWHAICGVRIVCLNDAEGVQPIGAVWKIAVPPNAIDNFHMGAYGNLVAEIDIETGEIGRVVNGLWPRAKVLERHPVTGASFRGFKLPDWPRLLEICRQAGPVFPLMKIQYWDFALTDKGPVILELNDMGGTQIMQLSGQGMLTNKIRRFLMQHLDPLAHPWVNAL